MLKLVLVLLVIFTVNCSLSDAIISARESFFTARQMGQSMAQCFGQNEIINCLENIIFGTLDKAIASNETWHLSDFVVIEKNSNTPSSSYNPSNKQYYDKLQNLSTGRSLSDTLAMKILQLAQIRSLKLQLPSSVNKLFHERSFSSALGDFNADDNDVENNEDAGDSQLEQEEGTQRILNGLVDDKILNIKKQSKKPFKKIKSSYSSPLDFSLTPLPNPAPSLLKNPNKHNENEHKPKHNDKYKKLNKHENNKLKNKIYYSSFNIKNSKGRKKKDKDKNMAVMGGMAMLAMVAQMFLGKVILIAGAAFVMAKVALLISVLVSNFQLYFVTV